MNIENLKKVAEAIKTVPQSKFDMHNMWYCVIGHSYKLLGDKSGNPIQWFDRFVETENFSERQYIVSGRWYEHDNSVAGAVKRIEEVIHHLQSPAPDPNYFKEKLKEIGYCSTRRV